MRSQMKNNFKLGQIVRYGLVGIFSNMAAYALYLLLTYSGADPKLAITILYPAAATLAYWGHARYSFTYRGGHFSGLSKYILAHLAGYLLNLSLLYVFVDRLHFQHQPVQLANVFLVAGFLFMAFKFLVFRTDEHTTSRAPE